MNSYIANSNSQNDNEDQNYSPPIDCKYYSIDEFTDATFKANKVTLIFHINIHSIEKHIDELRNYLMLIDFQFYALVNQNYKQVLNLKWILQSMDITTL